MVRAVATRAAAVTLAALAQREVELRHAMEQHGTLAHRVATHFRPACWGSHAMASQLAAALAGLSVPGGAQSEVRQISERTPAELQGHMRGLLTRELTAYWVPLAGRRRFRSVAAHAVGKAAVEEAVSVESSTACLAVVRVRHGGGSMCRRRPHACSLESRRGVHFSRHDLLGRTCDIRRLSRLADGELGRLSISVKDWNLFLTARSNRKPEFHVESSVVSPKPQTRTSGAEEPRK